MNDIMFWVKLIKTPDNSQCLRDNCTHVSGEYWIFEGDIEAIEDELSEYEIIAEGAVPGLGGMDQCCLIAGCEQWFGVEIEPDGEKESLRDKIARLEAECAALKADAERYRFIRSKIGYDRYGVTLPCGNTKVNPNNTDSAIDAAMHAGEKP